jgi:hypothetical protein
MNRGCAGKYNLRIPLFCKNAKLNVYNLHVPCYNRLNEVPDNTKDLIYNSLRKSGKLYIIFDKSSSFYIVLNNLSLLFVYSFGVAFVFICEAEAKHL